MGKAKALRLGIKKGVQHTFEKIQVLADRPFVDRMISKLRCTACGHPSESHQRRRPPFEDWDARKLWDALQSTGSRGSGGFLECAFYFCDDCKKDVIEDAKNKRGNPNVG